MVNEYKMILMLAWGGVCFSLGGMTGGRLVRRYLLPLGLAFILAISHVLLWKAIMFGILLSFSLHLGYGEKVPYWRKLLVFYLYALSTIFIGFSMLQVALPLVMLGLFKLSNTEPFAKDFVWKVVEFIFGMLISWMLIGAMK